MKKAACIVVIAAVAVWLAVIFSFSSEDKRESTDTSHEFIRVVLSVIDSDFDSLSSKEQLARIKQYDHYVRKAAHFTVYSVLGFLNYAALTVFGCKKSYSPHIALGLSAVYALSDEIHQYFVPGRSCQFRDICIDSLGAALGCLVFFVLYTIIRKAVDSYKRRKLKSAAVITETGDIHGKS